MAAKKQYIDRLPKKPHPAADRGNSIHKSAEDFIRGTSDVYDRVLDVAEPLLTEFRQGFIDSSVAVEQPWAYDRDWQPCDYDSDRAWTRGLLDVFKWVTPLAHMHGYDWKTGKRYPPKHLQQEQLYAVFAFERYPTLETFDFSFVYLDEKGDLANRMTHRTYTRANTIRLRDNFTKRGLRMTNDIIFKPAPNAVNCRFCDFKDSCEWAVK